MKDFANKIRSASSTLLHSGYAIVRLEADDLHLLDGVFDQAGGFFDRDASDKERFARPDILEGYRGFGAEFSEAPDRPDLNETFSLVPRNMAREDLADWPALNPLHRAMGAIAPLYCDLADGVLEDLRRFINPAGDRIASAEFSYLQLNYYRPGRETRELLQDGHEDGHLLTIVTSRQPGLEMKVGGRFEPATLARDEVLIMPGSILTLMTGGLTTPLIHRVRRVGGYKARASLMFFVNASITNAPRAWAPSDDGAYPDIRQATIESSQMFGLPSIAAVAR
ncbi:MAG: 2OG-Fe(II) oxygenase family protein [Hansschlegelia sp.]